MKEINYIKIHHLLPETSNIIRDMDKKYSVYRKINTFYRTITREQLEYLR